MHAHTGVLLMHVCATTYQWETGNGIWEFIFSLYCMSLEYQTQIIRLSARNLCHLNHFAGLDFVLIQWVNPEIGSIYRLLLRCLSVPSIFFFRSSFVLFFLLWSYKKFSGSGSWALFIPSAHLLFHFFHYFIFIRSLHLFWGRAAFSMYWILVCVVWAPGLVAWNCFTLSLSSDDLYFNFKGEFC